MRIFVYVTIIKDTGRQCVPQGEFSCINSSDIKGDHGVQTINAPLSWSPERLANSLDIFAVSLSSSRISAELNQLHLFLANLSIPHIHNVDIAPSLLLHLCLHRPLPRPGIPSTQYSPRSRRRLLQVHYSGHRQLSGQQ